MPRVQYLGERDKENKILNKFYKSKNLKELLASGDVNSSKHILC